MIDEWPADKQYPRWWQCPTGSTHFFASMSHGGASLAAYQSSLQGSCCSLQNAC